jgi:glutathione peroxidase
MVNQMSNLKKTGLIALLLTGIVAAYVAFVNRNSAELSIKQKLLKAAYPLLMWMTKMSNTQSTILKGSASAPISFYTLEATSIDGTIVPFESYKGKFLLVVNTASECGYTNQYEGLQKLYEKYSNKLNILGFPSNDFKEQEKGSNEQIASFCKKNFGVSFPLFQKGVVLPGEQQQKIYQWLTDATKNGWNKQPPTWNFSKYLIDTNGNLVGYFGPSVDPMSETITNYFN